MTVGKTLEGKAIAFDGQPWEDRPGDLGPRGEEIGARIDAFRRVVAEFVQAMSREIDGGSLTPEELARTNLRVIRTVFGNGSIEILVALHSLGTVGVQELRRHLLGGSPRVLSTKLQVLGGLGLVSRGVTLDHPPRVQYRLTDSGLTVANLGAPVILYLRLLESHP